MQFCRLLNGFFFHSFFYFHYGYVLGENGIQEKGYLPRLISDFFEVIRDQTLPKSFAGKFISSYHNYTRHGCLLRPGVFIINASGSL